MSKVNETQQEKPQQKLWLFLLVREAGVEPARPCEHWHLKPASLPIPPLAQVAQQLISAGLILSRRTAFVNNFFRLSFLFLLIDFSVPVHYSIR